MVKGKNVKLVLKPVLKEKLDEKADSLGIDTADYVRILIIEDLKKTQKFK